MNMHKYEKWWLVFGSGTLLVFLVVVGISAFYMGSKPPSCAVTLNPETVRESPTFKEPGLKEIGDNEYSLAIVASAFDDDVGEDDKVVEIPKGTTVHISGTTTDVIHGYEIAGTNANMMLVPGYVSTYTNTFKNVRIYTVVCNVYCGVEQHIMAEMIEVDEE